MSEQTATRKLLVLARGDHGEAMRVAAGMTIFGHEVRLVLMARPLTEAEMSGDRAELLELSGITPETTVPQMADMLDWLCARDLAAAIKECDAVVSL